MSKGSEKTRASCYQLSIFARKHGFFAVLNALFQKQRTDKFSQAINSFAILSVSFFVKAAYCTSASIFFAVSACLYMP